MQLQARIIKAFVLRILGTNCNYCIFSASLHLTIQMLYHFVVSNRVEALFQRWRLAALCRHLYWWYWFSPNLKNWFILLSLKRGKKKNGKDILSMPKTHMYFQKKKLACEFLNSQMPLIYIFWCCTHRELNCQVLRGLSEQNHVCAALWKLRSLSQNQFGIFWYHLLMFCYLFIYLVIFLFFSV